MVVDVVTGGRESLHVELGRLTGWVFNQEVLPDRPLYAAVYRPVIRGGSPQIDIWLNQFNIGDALPTMPLRLIADYFVPVELEATYVETCRRRRLTA